MNEQRKFRSVLTKHCSSLRIITGMRAAIDQKRIEVSIEAKGTRKSKRLKTLAKRVRRMEKELKKTFPRRKVSIDIWAIDKAHSRNKVSKPFRGKDITLITAPIKL